LLCIKRIELFLNVFYWYMPVMSDDVLNSVAVLFQSPEMVNGLTQLLKTNTTISELVLSNVGLKW